MFHRIILAVFLLVLAGCAPKQAYEPKLTFDNSEESHAAFWLRHVTFKPTDKEVFPVASERGVVGLAQADFPEAARKVIAQVLASKGLAAPSEAQAKYILDVEVVKLELTGVPMGVAYVTAFNYTLSEAGAAMPVFTKRFDDSGATKGEVNLTWGDVIGAAGAGLAGGLTGIQPVVNVEEGAEGSKSGLRPSLLQKALRVGWVDAVGKNSDRYFTDMPYSLRYRLGVRQQEQAALAAGK
jgi:hypothetical protein